MGARSPIPRRWRSDPRRESPRPAAPAVAWKFRPDGPLLASSAGTRGPPRAQPTRDDTALQGASRNDTLDPQARPGTTELLVFELSGVRYALNLACVREVVRAVMITPLPEAPPVVEGVIDVRGELVPVYDLRLRFGHPPRTLDPEDRLIVAWTGDRLVAMRCDRTEWIQDVPRAAIEEPQFGRGGRIAGVAKLDDGVALIHDLPRFLEEAEAIALEQALAAHDARDAE